ncbi:facilitated trehalose transporter Tret1 [Nilaparvata lugens]|uniref:Sugar transporter n=1 Tax=Nilaparvata lugens TaxID=108931 RepID=A0A0A8J7X6_NILLU|nr:facilitated trehalose transporter Tret1 [Nilaparvata lugens]XP_022201483.2 facilitated trehalose transporter Tret1 [Nilaparvata lugens]BAQ02352.1 sugar transporter [Nilaparvata lugens]
MLAILTPSGRRQYAAAVCSSISVLMAGSTIGWITPILVGLLGPDSEVPMTADESSWVASVIEVGNFVTPLPFGLLVDRWGRKPCLLSIAPMYIVSWLLVLATRSVLVLYFVRFVQGLAMGVVFTVLPMYLAEIAGADIRGALSAFFQGMWYMGILTEYCVGPYVSYQTLAYVSLAFPLIFLLTFVWIPESPYYLLMKGEEEKAGVALAWLRGESSPARVSEELQSMKMSVEKEMLRKGSWNDLVSTAANRKALLIVLIAALAEIMSGITAILTYASQTFGAADAKEGLTPDECTILMGLLVLMATVFAGGVVDVMGRKPLMLASALGCAVCELIAGVYYFLQEKTSIDVTSYRWVAFSSITGYCVILSAGLGPVVATFQGELFPSNTRGLASAVVAISVTISSFFWMKLYQVIADHIGIYLNYFLFSLCCLVSSVFILFLVPETKGKTLAEIQSDLNSAHPPKPKKMAANEAVL